jgi:penicillin-binding protein 1A
MAKSINSIPVQLSIAIGQDLHPNHVGRAARHGRDTIVQLLRKMGVTSEMKDTPSMPIGSVEMTVVEMAQSYAAFPNAGRKVEPYAALEVRNTRGDVIFRHDRDADPQPQIMRPQTASDMNFLMSKVPEEGTARRAALPGIRSAGKTGTTDEYRNAWYVGYTGNYVTAVWLGNDDYSPTSNMTGGSLPAMVWHEIMVYAHDGLDLKPIYGLPPLERPAPGAVAARPASAPLVNSPDRPVVLNRRSTDVLGAIENTMRASQAHRAPAQAGGFEVLNPPAPGGPRSLANRAVGGVQ